MKNPPKMQWGKYLRSELYQSLKAAFYKYPITRNILVRKRGYKLTGPLKGFRVRSYHKAYIDGTYEPDISQVMMKAIRPGWVCVDVGANVGYFSLLMAKLAGPSGMVYAFEANPKTADELHLNIKVNGYKNNVKIENLAITDGSQKKIKLYEGKRKSCNTWSLYRNRNIDQTNISDSFYKVNAASLDSYFLTNNKIDLIKMDIEGAETLALIGMRRIIKENRPLLIIEFHNDVAWKAGCGLINNDYILFDLEKKRIINENNKEVRAFHCLALRRGEGTLIFEEV